MLNPSVFSLLIRQFGNDPLRGGEVCHVCASYPEWSMPCANRARTNHHELGKGVRYARGSETYGLGNLL